MVSGERAKALAEFARKCRIPQKNLEILDLALTHKSYANEAMRHKGALLAENHNERLEFLGDSVLGLVIADYLYHRYPHLSEGRLTARKAQLVCAPTLAEIAEKLNLGDFLMRGRGESRTKHSKGVLADSLEALIGAIFLIGGLRSVKSFVLRHWEPYLSEGRKVEESIDYKSWLQVYLAKTKKVQPEYKLVSALGPDHSKIFTVELWIEGKKVGEGTAPSRKKADQMAAKNFIEKNRLGGPEKEL
ncbi:MAG: ribonuclease III [Leptospiraceae bacterium]|nr:ribonuclease III [Leptospiraceae bacterium]MDW8306827.1 ribonuclease III [Leptospiraceae bacterium]